MQPVPLLVIKSVKCDFYKDTEFLLKTVIIDLFRNPSSQSHPTAVASPPKSRTRETRDSSLGTSFYASR